MLQLHHHRSNHLTLTERKNEYFQSNENCVKSVRIRSFSGPYFPVFPPNAGKYGPGKAPYLDTFHTVEKISINVYLFLRWPFY